MTSAEQQQNKTESRTMNPTNESDRVREIKRAGQHSRTSERPSTSTISSRLLAPTAASRARVAATLNNSNEPEKHEQKPHVRKQESGPSVLRQRQSTSRRTTSLQSSTSSASSTASRRPPSYAAPTRSSLMRSGSLSTSATTTRPIVHKKNPEQKSAVLSDNQATPISPHSPVVKRTSSIQHPPTKVLEESSCRLDWEEKLAVLTKEASEKDKAIADLEARLAALEEELKKALSLNKEKDARIENLEHEVSYSRQMERSTSSESSKSSRKSLSTGVDVANIVKKLDHQSVCPDVFQHHLFVSFFLLIFVQF
ncbi:hypothetical protein BZA70DRAFT_277537 [Myxozyma melibiosi]|uniref:Uncharacterized protein n=1 Tax=Myxozyma melibiosi TaxID=54550 RepID=A0ABR1F7Z9_9ASCO